MSDIFSVISRLTLSPPVQPISSGSFFCGHQFSCIVLNVVNQIRAYQINQLYLVVHYVECLVLGGQCRVNAEMMLSTSIIF